MQPTVYKTSNRIKGRNRNRHWHRGRGYFVPSGCFFRGACVMGREKIIRNDVAKGAARELDPLRGIKGPIYLRILREISDKGSRGFLVRGSGRGPKRVEASLERQALHIEDGFTAALNRQATLNGGKACGAIDSDEPVCIVQDDIDAGLSQIVGPAF